MVVSCQFRFWLASSTHCYNPFTVVKRWIHSLLSIFSRFTEHQVYFSLITTTLCLSFNICCVLHLHVYNTSCITQQVGVLQWFMFCAKFQTIFFLKSGFLLLTCSLLKGKHILCRHACLFIQPTVQNIPGNKLYFAL